MYKKRTDFRGRQISTTNAKYTVSVFMRHFELKTGFDL